MQKVSHWLYIRSSIGYLHPEDRRILEVTSLCIISCWNGKVQFFYHIKPSASACFVSVSIWIGSSQFTLNKETRLGQTLNIAKLRVVPCQKMRESARRPSLIYVRPDLCVGGEIEIHKWRIYWNVSRTMPSEYQGVALTYANCIDHLALWNSCISLRYSRNRFITITTHMSRPHLYSYFYWSIDSKLIWQCYFMLCAKERDSATSTGLVYRCK